MRQSMPFLLALFLLAYSLGWAADSTDQASQDQQAALCTSDHIAGDQAQQTDTEATCSTDNPSVQFTATDFLSAAVNSGLTTELPPLLNRNHQSKDSANADTHMSAGETYGPLNIWGAIGWRSLDNDFVSTTYNSTANSMMAGADLQPLDPLVIGIAVGIENNDVSTVFNSGSQEILSLTGLGYLGYLVGDTVSVDFVLGTSSVDIDQDRTLSPFGAAAGPFAGVAAGTSIVSEVNAARYFAAMNVNGFWTLNDWRIGANAGYLQAYESRDAFTESGGGVTNGIAGSNSNLAQLRVGGDVSYSIKAFEPYLGLDYYNDINRDDVVVSAAQAQPSNDNDEIVLSTGFRYFSPGGMATSLEYTKSFTRDDIDSNSLSIILSTEW